jgi:predicted ATPase
MSKIKIRNFGPINEGLIDDKYIKMKKVTIFIGNQATGKSTIVKTYSTFSWLEKALNRRMLKINYIRDNDNFICEYFNYQGLSGYFRKNTYLEYRGKSYSFIYENENLTIEKINKNYLIPKIMYIPAERNFISAIESPETIKGLPKPLYTFLGEFEKAKKSIIKSDMPINGIKFDYDKTRNISYISGENYKIPLLNASSGIQSATPLYLVSKFLSNEEYKSSRSSLRELSLEENSKSIDLIQHLIEKQINSKRELPKELEELLLGSIYSRYKTDYFINIVEELEQNLYPKSQRSLLYSLFEFVNINENNKLILTTHSPFIINYLTLSIKSEMIHKKIQQKNYLQNPLDSIIPSSAYINGEDAIVYELDDKGFVRKLSTYKNMPNDENYLNMLLDDTNNDFSKLLDIEDEI